MPNSSRGRSRPSPRAASSSRLEACATEGRPGCCACAAGDVERTGVLRLGATDDDGTRTEAAALKAAFAGGLAVPARPRASGSNPSRHCCSSRRSTAASAIPAERPTPRLRALGAAAARIHRTTPPAGLPRRTRSIAGVDFDALRRAAPPQPLLQRAEAVAARGPSTAAADGFVHGDLWQGNTLWQGDDLVAHHRLGLRGAGSGRRRPRVAALRRRPDLRRRCRRRRARRLAGGGRPAGRRTWTTGMSWQPSRRHPTSAGSWTPSAHKGAPTSPGSCSWNAATGSSAGPSNDSAE